jgi:hypothetical protein
VNGVTMKPMKRTRRTRELVAPSPPSSSPNDTVRVSPGDSVHFAIFFRLSDTRRRPRVIISAHASHALHSNLSSRICRSPPLSRSPSPTAVRPLPSRRRLLARITFPRI